MKKMKANKMTKTSSVANTSIDDKSKTTYERKKGDPRVDGDLIGKKSKSQKTPFLLTFKIFNHNVHNCLVDSRASSNVIPYLVYKKLNAEPQICKMRIVQLDRSNVKVIGELKYVLIQLDSNSKLHQTIDIIVVDIPEAYGMFLSRDLSTKCNGYFATD